MAEMKFKFTIQPYQTEAVDSVVGVFAGQPFNDRFTYRRDVHIVRDVTNWDTPDEELYMGFANAKVQLDIGQLLANINRIQARNNINRSQTVKSGGFGACSLDIEMETGTGKTYVYIKTMFELNKLYGWSKFIVVVPSIAIREGVRKSFETMEDHFMEYYGKKARAFVYDSKNLTEIDSFSQSADINVMIINIQAFNSTFDESKKNSVSKIINSARDNFGSRKPIDVIAANRPIVIMDEPQKMGGSATQAGIKRFNPLFCLNYSATHKEHHDLVYVLDALDAYNKRLVKKIEVKGFDIKNLRGTDSYLFLESIVISPKKPPMARIEFEISYNKSINRETRILGTDDDLFSLSKNMEQYRGYRISEIDPIRKQVSFTNGDIIHVGEVVGDVSEKDMRRVQIRETIRSHFEKEKELFGKGIKCLSLFFIDEVAKYRKYDEDGNEINSEYGDIFEQEYVSILNEYLTIFNTPYEQYLREIDVHQTHAGYFSIDKKGRKVDSKTKRGSDESDDISAYDLILKDKERLLSFSNPVRFIFSHSALREGWDNPNVFQICTLKHGGSSPTQKRQEVGRGLRLCVNQNGDRMDVDTLGSQVQQVNQLTVIASDGYRDFVSDLQKGIREDLYDRPTKASAEYFIGKTLVINENEVTVTDKQGRDIYRYLVKNDYIDDDDHVTDKYRADKENNVLAPVPESCREISDGVHALIQSIFDPHALDDMIKDGHDTKIAENPLNDNFYKKEFQKLWNLINHKYAYTVEFDSAELIRKAIAHINEKMFVARLQYTVTSGQQEKDWNADHIKSGSMFVAETSRTYNLDRAEGSMVTYDLVGKIAEGTKLTRRTVAAILGGIQPAKFAMFKNNPEEFITKAIRLINEQKPKMTARQLLAATRESVQKDKTTEDELLALLMDTTTLCSIDKDMRESVFRQAISLPKMKSGKLHPDVVGYKQSIEKWENTTGYTARENVPANIQNIAKNTRKRVYGIMDILVQGIAPFGGKMKEGAFLEIGKERIRIEFAEGTDEVPHVLTKEEAKQLAKYNDEKRWGGYASKPNIRKYDHPYNGLLRVRIGNTYYGEGDRISIGDSREGIHLEDRMDEIMIAVFEKMELHRIRREDEEEKARRQEEEKRRAEEHWQRISEEKDKTRELIARARRHRVAMEIREYVSAMLKAEWEEYSSEWAEWALKKADWYDPVTEREDELLGKDIDLKKQEQKTRPYWNGFY